MTSREKLPSIILCGATGSGKSSIINFLLMENCAPIGKGEVCTKGHVIYNHQFITICDTEGYEIGCDRQEYKKFLFTKLKEFRKIKIIWYVVSGAGLRFTDLDKAVIEEIKSVGYHIAVLITKADEMDSDQLNDLCNKIHNEFPHIDVFNLSINQKNNKELQEICEWNKLQNWTYIKHNNGGF
jgi:GTPase Era involved in 16S rRNA processing